MDRPEWEDRCDHCGICCKAAVVVGGTKVVVEGLNCICLGEDNKCTVYATRFQEAPWCMHASQAARVQGLRHDCPYLEGTEAPGKVQLSPEAYRKVFPSLAEAVLKVTPAAVHFTWKQFFREARLLDPRYTWKLWVAATGTHVRVSRQLTLSEKFRRMFSSEA